MPVTITKYKQANLPKPGSEIGQKIANYVYEWYRYASDSRLNLAQDIWPKCDDAYHCFRELPTNSAMKWADTGDLGETDLKDAVDFLSDAIMLSLMGRDDSWFQPVSYKTEEQGIQNIIRDYLAYKHREASTREMYGIHLGQVMRRGTGAISLEWRKTYRKVRMGAMESLAMAPEIQQMAQEQHGMDIPTEDIAKVLTRQTKDVISFNGPVIRPLDMYDVFLDPVADIRNVQDAPMATMVYKTPEELKDTYEDDEVTKFYSNLDDLKEWSPNEIYMSEPMRYRSTMTMGLNPFLSGDTKSKFIPVLVFHKQVLKLEGNVWVDCFFHVALTGGKNGGRLIACHENPSDEGRRDVFIDTYRDWLNCSYGISAIEKSLPDWNKKNVASALGLNASLVEIFPPLAVISNMLTDDRRIDVKPGGYNVISFKPSVLTNFCAPLPIAKGGAENAMSYSRFLGQKILGQMGAYGSIMQDPTKSMASAKTATQINTETTSGTVGRDNFLEKLTKNLEHLCQAFYDLCRQNDQGGENGMIKFIQNVDGSGDVSVAQLSKEILDQDRRIVVTGWHGMQNKQQELDMTKQILEVLTQGGGIQFLPTGPLVAQDVLFKLLGLLGLKDIAKYKTDPATLLLQQPQVQIELNQMMAQLQASGVPPQILQLIAQVLQIVPIDPATGQPMQPGGAPGAAPQGQPPPPMGAGPGPQQGNNGGGPPAGQGPAGQGAIKGPARINPKNPAAIHGGQEVG